MFIKHAINLIKMLITLSKIYYSRGTTTNLLQNIGHFDNLHTVSN